MNEIIKKDLDFLCIDYEMKYQHRCIKNYPRGNYDLDVYSYYNETGCFSILYIAVRNDLTFAVFDNIDFIDTYIEPDFLSRSKYWVDVTTIQKDNWNEKERILFIKNPFFWWSKKKIFQTLGEAIKKEILQHNGFYGINIVTRNHNM